MEIHKKNIKFKTLLGVLTILLIIVFFIKHYSSNSVLIINESKMPLENIAVYKPHAKKGDILLWKGQIQGNNQKAIAIPSGTSDSSLILLSTWQGQTFKKEQKYPAIGPGNFIFTISKDGEASLNTSIRLFPF